MQIGVTFSEAVTIDTTGGQPYLSVRMEGYDANVPYKQGSGTTQLVFAKTFSDTDHSGLQKSFAVDDPALHSARGLQLNGATIRSTADDNTAVLTGTSLARTDNAHMIGVVMTGTTLTSSPATGDTYANGERLTLTADFNAPIGTISGGNSTLVLAFDSGDREAEHSHFVGNKVHYGYTITDSDTDANGVGIPKDALKLNGAQFGRQGSRVNFVACNEAIATLSSDTVDGIRPTLVTTAPDAPATSADGTQIVLTFDEELSATTAGTGDFEVTVSAMERSVTAVEVDADDNTLVKLTLGSAVGMMDTITVSYTDPSADNDSNAVQDSVGNDLLSFAGQSVSNNAPAGVTISSVVLSSDPGTDKTYAIDDVVTATVTLSEAVSLTGTPRLELDVGGTPRTADCVLATDTSKLACTYTIVAEDDSDGIAIGANKLTLNGASISKASGDPGGVILAHGAKNADSDHKVDGVRPTPARASADGTALTLVWSEALNTGSTPAGSAFTLTVSSGTAPTVDSVSIEEDTATLTLSGAVDTTKTYTLAYVVPMTNPIEDAVGNPAVDFTGQSVSTIVLTWNFTVTSDTTDEDGNPVIVEGGHSATATATITNVGYTPPANVTVELEWGATALGGINFPGDLLEAPGGASSITILAGMTSAEVTIAATTDELYFSPATAELTASYLGTEIGTATLTAKDDEERPTITISSSADTVTEGESIVLTATLNRGYENDTAPVAEATDESNVLEFPILDGLVVFDFLFQGQTETTGTVATDNDGTAEAPAEVQFEMQDSESYTRGNTEPLKVRVLDNDTAPSKPQSIKAEAKYTAVTLTWDDPAEDGGQTITKYEYRYSDDNGGTWGPGTGTEGWADVPMSNVGEANRNSYTVTGLDNGTAYTFEVRGVNVAGGGDEASIDETPIDATWAFTVTPSSTDSHGDPVATITEGNTITARVEITNTVRFDDPVDVTLQWGGASLSGALEGAAGASIITIAANGDNATLAISAPDDPANAPFYLPTATEPLTATVRTVEIGSIALTRRDDEPKPSVTLEASTTRLTEGGDIVLTATRTIASVEQSIPLATTDDDTALTGTIPSAIVIAHSDTEASVTVSTDDNSAMDGARTVSFALGENTDAPHYTLGTDSSVDITVLDNDTPPGTPQNFIAAGGYKKVVLAWQEPLSDGGQGVEHYEYRYSDDGEMTWEPGTAANDGWAMVPDSGEGGANRNGLVIDPLVAGTEYDFELRAHNTAGGGGVASDKATPMVPAWAFTVRGASTNSMGKASANIVEGGSSVIAELTITNDVRFPTEEIVHLTWGGAKLDVSGSHVVGAGGATTITMPIGQAEATFALSAPDLDTALGSVLYHPPQAQALTATHDDTAIDSVTLTRIDKAPRPRVTVEMTPARLSEGENAEMKVLVTPTVAVPFDVILQISDPDNALTATPATTVSLLATQVSRGDSVTTDDNGTQDPTRTVTVEVKANADYPWYSPGDPSTATLTVLDNDTPPPAPPGFKAKGGNGQATLTWNAPPANSGGRQPIQRYEVRWKETAASAYTVMWSSVGTARTYTVESLTNKTPYTFQVRAKNVAGYGPNATTTATPSEVSVPGVPQNVRGTAGLRYARFTWEAPESDGNSPIVRYEYSPVPIHDPRLNPWINIGLTYELEFTQARTGTHKFWVRAVNAIGPGPESELVTVHVAQSDTTTPSEPQGLRVDTDNSSRAKLKWGAPATPGRFTRHGLPHRGVPGALRRRDELDRAGRRHRRHGRALDPRGAGPRGHPQEHLPCEGDQQRPGRGRSDHRPAGADRGVGVQRHLDQPHHRRAADLGRHAGRHADLRPLLEGRRLVDAQAQAVRAAGRRRDLAATVVRGSESIDDVPGRDGLRRHLRLAPQAERDGDDAARRHPKGGREPLPGRRGGPRRRRERRRRTGRERADPDRDGRERHLPAAAQSLRRPAHGVHANAQIACGRSAGHDTGHRRTDADGARVRGHRARRMADGHGDGTRGRRLPGRTAAECAAVGTAQGGLQPRRLHRHRGRRRRGPGLERHRDDERSNHRRSKRHDRRAHRAWKRARREPPAHGQVHLGSSARSDGVLHQVG